MAALEEEAHTSENPLRELSRQYRDTPSLTKEMVRGDLFRIFTSIRIRRLRLYGNSGTALQT